MITINGVPIITAESPTTNTQTHKDRQDEYIQILFFAVLAVGGFQCHLKFRHKMAETDNISISITKPDSKNDIHDSPGAFKRVGQYHFLLLSVLTSPPPPPPATFQQGSRGPSWQGWTAAG